MFVDCSTGVATFENRVQLDVAAPVPFPPVVHHLPHTPDCGTADGPPTSPSPEIVCRLVSSILNFRCAEGSPVASLSHSALRTLGLHSSLWAPPRSLMLLHRKHPGACPNTAISSAQALRRRGSGGRGVSASTSAIGVGGRASGFASP